MNIIMKRLLYLLLALYTAPYYLNVWKRAVVFPTPALINPTQATLYLVGPS